MKSVDPATGKTIKVYEEHAPAQVDEILSRSLAARREWRSTSFVRRGELMKAVGGKLRERKAAFAELMAAEMGKPLRDGEAEVEKCAGCCDWYAERAEGILADLSIETDARESYVAFDPLGGVLAVMPWNFPFWQVFRFAAPSLMAGNVGLLKHASNVSGCALAIEAAFADAGFPRGVFSTLLVPGAKASALLGRAEINAVTLTGSGPAGQDVAAAAGRALKKSVLELGGSDPYVILEDADLELAVKVCAQSRLINAGQSCIAAKRFIVVESRAAEFSERFIERFRAVRAGDPRDPSSDIGPLARVDLRDELHKQVELSLRQGAKLACGGKTPGGAGAFYPATVLLDAKPGTAVFDDETFGPVAAICSAKNEREAIDLANQSPYGLGAALFTRDRDRARRLARDLEAGSVFVNALVKSDVRLPFGGVKASGYGRELSAFGIKEFVNAKTVYHADA